MTSHVELRLAERVMPVVAEHAMELLRDRRELATFIARIATRESALVHAERVALELSARPDGPRLVVTRDGHGVTCLAQGMTSNLAAVPFRYVDAFVRSSKDHLRAQVLLQREDTTSDQSPARRIWNQPHRLTRAEHDNLRTVSILVRDELTAFVRRFGHEMIRMTANGRARELDPAKAEDVWRAYCTCLWAVMACAHEPMMFEPALALACCGDPHLEQRGLWVVVNQPERILDVMGLARSAGKRTLGAIVARPVDYASVRFEGYRRDLKAAYRAICHQPPRAAEEHTLEHLEDPERLKRMVRGCVLPSMPLFLFKFIPPDAAARMVDNSEHLQRVSAANMLGQRDPHEVARELDVWFHDALLAWRPFEHLDRPVPLQARPAASLTRAERIRNRMWRWALRNDSWVNDNRDRIVEVLTTAAPMEALIPADFPDAFWAMKRGRSYVINELPKRIFEAAHGPIEPVEPVRILRVAGRNDPCPCGSGKKFKKCCGVDA